MDFKEYMHECQEKAVIMQRDEIPKEKVTEIEFAQAHWILSNYQIENEFGMFLFCASLNLLNTFVKQKGVEKKYNFKNKVEILYFLMLKKNFHHIHMDFQCQNKTARSGLALIQFGDVQFSFHNVRNSQLIQAAMMSKFASEIEWDGIRKQKCALTMFHLALHGMELFLSKDKYDALSKSLDEAAKEYLLNDYEIKFLTSITIYTNRFEESKKFYQYVLKLPISDKEDDYVIFTANHTFLKLKANMNIQNQQAVYLTFVVQNIDVAVKAFALHGWHAKQVDSEQKTAMFLAPEGTKIIIQEE